MFAQIDTVMSHYEKLTPHVSQLRASDIFIVHSSSVAL